MTVLDFVTPPDNNKTLTDSSSQSYDFSRVFPVTETGCSYASQIKPIMLDVWAKI